MTYNNNQKGHEMVLFDNLPSHFRKEINYSSYRENPIDYVYKYINSAKENDLLAQKLQKLLNSI